MEEIRGRNRNSGKEKAKESTATTDRVLSQVSHRAVPIQSRAGKIWNFERNSQYERTGSRF